MIGKILWNWIFFIHSAWRAENEWMNVKCIQAVCEIEKRNSFENEMKWMKKLVTARTKKILIFTTTTTYFSFLHRAHNGTWTLLSSLSSNERKKTRDNNNNNNVTRNWKWKNSVETRNNYQFKQTKMMMIMRFYSNFFSSQSCLPFAINVTIKHNFSYFSFPETENGSFRFE